MEFTMSDYTVLEQTMQNEVFDILTSDWYSKSTLRYKLNIFNVSKVLYELLKIINSQDNYILISKLKHGYANDEKYYQFSAYRIIQRKDLKQYPNAEIVDDIDEFKPPKYDFQDKSVDIDKPLYGSYNRDSRRNSRYNERLQPRSYYDDDFEDSTYSSSSYSRRVSPSDSDLDRHTDEFFWKMADFEDIYDCDFT